MASLYKRRRKDGSHVWYVVWWQDGRAMMKSTRSSDKRLALELLKRWEEDRIRIAQGLMPVEKTQPITLTEFTFLYLAEREQSRRAKNTIQADRLALRHFCDFAGDRLLTTITPRTVREFRSSVASTLKSASVNLLLRHLKAAFAWALDGSPQKFLSVNPFKQRDLFLKDDEERPPRCLNPSEKDAFFSAVDNPAHQRLFQFLLLTGCRRDEALNLTWDDIDWEHHQIVFRRTKSKKSRIVPVGLELLQVLMALDRSLRRPFPYSSHYASHLFKRYAKTAGLKDDLHLHCLRHTAASDLVRAGIHPMQIQKLLGHASISITQRYVWVLPEDLRDAAERLTCLG